MKKLEQLYEGKAKKVFATEDPDIVIVDYKDDATAFNGEKKGTIVGKGVINNRMTNYVFQVLEKEGVPTHYLFRRICISISYNSILIYYFNHFPAYRGTLSSGHFPKRTLPLAFPVPRSHLYP